MCVFFSFPFVAFLLGCDDLGKSMPFCIMWLKFSLFTNVGVINLIYIMVEELTSKSYKWHYFNPGHLGQKKSWLTLCSVQVHIGSPCVRQV